MPLSATFTPTTAGAIACAPSSSTRGPIASCAARHDRSGTSTNRGTLAPCVPPERKQKMPVTVRIPTPLRSLTGGEEQVQSSGATVRAVIDELEQKHPGMRDRLLDDKGVRRFVNIYVGDEDIRFLDGLDTKLESGVEISIVPAIAGGS